MLMEERVESSSSASTRVIRHQPTHTFFARGGWTPDFGVAEKFKDVGSVLKTQQRYQLKDVEVVLVLMGEPSAYDITLPLS
jgi:hypothetical protein